MKIQLANGAQLDALGVHGQNIFYQEINRDCLTFLFDPETVSLEAVCATFVPENCAAIQITDDTGTFLHENYTIRVQAGTGCQEYILTGSVKEDTGLCVFVKMAQSTLAERQILEQQAAIDALVVAALEG